MSACDFATCKETAEHFAGKWMFCARHAEVDRRLADGEEPEAELVEDGFYDPAANGHGTAARARQHHRDGETPCPSCQAAATRYATDRGRLAMTTPASPTGLLLERASAHGSPKVVRMGQKIEGLLDDLRGLLKACEAEEEARKEIRRLEVELAEAKARLKGGNVTPIRTAAPGTSGLNTPLECRKGCGKVSHGGQGRAAHERACHSGEATG